MYLKINKLLFRGMSENIINIYINLQKELIKKYGNKSIVLYQVGSFYEMYGGKKHDLEDVSKALNIHLTRKNKSDEHSPYMCGFPDFSLEKHLSKLIISYHYTIAVYDQHDQEGKTSKKRILKEIISPSTYINDELIGSSNDLFCITIKDFKSIRGKQKLNNVCISSIDLSTGKNKISQFVDNVDNLNLPSITSGHRYYLVFIILLWC